MCEGAADGASKSEAGIERNALGLLFGDGGLRQSNGGGSHCEVGEDECDKMKSRFTQRIASIDVVLPADSVRGLLMLLGSLFGLNRHFATLLVRLVELGEILVRFNSCNYELSAYIYGRHGTDGSGIFHCL